jgi:hypothetical protein
MRSARLCCLAGTMYDGLPGLLRWARIVAESASMWDIVAELATMWDWNQLVSSSNPTTAISLEQLAVPFVVWPGTLSRTIVVNRKLWRTSRFYDGLPGLLRSARPS